MIDGIHQKVIDHLGQFLTPYNYSYHSESPGFFRNIDHQDYFSEFSLGLSVWLSNQAISHMELSFYEVEKYILLNDLIPSIHIPSLRKRPFAHSTIMLRGYEDLRGQNVKSQQDLEDFLSNIEKYLIEHAFPFVEQYASLETVLERMNELQAEGKLWNQILAGRPEFFFRGLIISKLCDDPQFQDKLTYVEAEMDDLIDDRWHPAFDIMCEILEDVKPL